MQNRVSIRKIFSLLIPWFFFLLMFAWGWRVRNLFTHIPSYGDTLEVLWAIEWYYQNLWVKRTFPWFDTSMFHPVGWHTGTLLVPLPFLLALPARILGGPAFAYNVLGIFALVVSFAGMYRFSQQFTTRPTTIFVSLAYTFWAMGWAKIQGGHLVIAWLSGLLPWLAWAVTRMKPSLDQSQQLKGTILVGFIWGLIINFSLYGIFMGALTFLLWGKALFRRIPQMIIAGLVAILIGFPAIFLRWSGSQQDYTRVFVAADSIWWGASLNSLFIPSVFHPIPFIRSFSQWIYRGPYDESGVMNFGLLTSLLAVLGVLFFIKQKPYLVNLVGLTLAGIILALGLLLRWNGEMVSLPVFRPLNLGLWAVGHFYKPEVFPRFYPVQLDTAIPLPSFLLTIFVPYWEGAHTLSRFAVLGMLGASVLAGLGLDRLPKLARIFLYALWIVEILPNPTASMPIPFEPHPAYAWLARQTFRPGEGIIDIAARRPILMIGGEIAWATWLHGKPTAAGMGSAWPGHSLILLEYLSENPSVFSEPEISLILQQYGVRYLFLHMLGEEEPEMWDIVQGNPAFRPIGCFQPLLEVNPWPYPICVASVEVKEEPINLFLKTRWLHLEEGGVWAEGEFSRAEWIAITKKDYVLEIQALPNCVPKQSQEITIQVNRKKVGFYRWKECILWQAEIPIPASIVKVGWNEIVLEYKYATSLPQNTTSSCPQLSVKFNVLKVR